MDNLCVKWDGFQKNIKLSFAELRDDKDFSDVTLACGDEIIEVHKIVLSASSSYFKKILKKIKYPHPTIFMGGVRAKDLLSIVDFMYYGEAIIHQENLNDFLSLAEQIELKGLNSADGEDLNEQDGTTSNDCIKTHPTENKARKVKNENLQFSENDMIHIKTETNTKPTHSKQTVTFDGDANEKIESLLEKQDGIWTCTICGIGKSHKGHMKMHAEIHLDGLAFPCKNCGKIFRSRSSFKMHKCNIEI